MNISENKFYGIRKGIIFYSYEDPDIEIIKQLFKEFCELTKPDFKYYCHQTAILKKLKGDGKEFFNSIMEKSNFNSTTTLELTDASKEKVQNVKVWLALSNNNEHMVCKLPNTIYFEFNKDIKWEQIYKFIRKACYSKTYRYICSSYVLATNDYEVGNATAKAMKVLKDSYTLNNYYSILNNTSFLMKFKEGIDGPNVIQVLSKEIYKNLDIENIKNEELKGNVSYEYAEDYLILNLLKDSIDENSIELKNKYKSLYNLLKPVIMNIKKPKMYWKEDDWKLWYERFKE